MKKFLAVTSIFVIPCALSSIALAQQKPAPKKTEAAHAVPTEKTAEGRITAVDAKTKTLTVAEGTKSMTFVWDEKTKITEAGHAVKPSALVSGAQVTVHYMEKGGKNVANSIVITSVVRRAKKQ